VDWSRYPEVRRSVDRARHKLRATALGGYLGALGVAAIIAYVSGLEFYRQGPMVLVAILLLVGIIYHVWYRRLSWERHPVLIALASRPETIVRAKVMEAHGRAALLEDREVTIETEGAWLMLSVRKVELPDLRRALAAYCDNIAFSGF
jgi:hypothetical protein